MANKNRRFSWLIPFSICFLCFSCNIDGRLYTQKTIPLTTDFNRTPTGSKKCIIENFKVKEPISRANISIEWTSGNIAKKAASEGITTIHYADLKVTSYILGIYTQKELILYGD